MRYRGLKGAVAVLVAVAGCGNNRQQLPGDPNGFTQDSHMWFPITTGVHAIGASTSQGAMACASCHPSTANSFKQFTCVACHDHEQAVTDRLHTSVKDYGYTSQQCLSCHPSGAKEPFDHSGITSNCAQCHDVGKQFGALPVPGFTHPPTNGADCAGCHNTKDWKTTAGAPPGKSSDPKTNVVVNALIPTYAGTTISSLTPRTEQLTMSMDHASPDIAPAALAACTSCHPNTSTGSYFPGNLHASLTMLGKMDPTITEPKACASCHSDAVPIGFVGPLATNPARTPPSGEMKHDAVAWTNGKPTTTALVSGSCNICHASPSSADGSWTAGIGGGLVAYHAPLDASGMPQPSSCIDCHANSLPTATTGSTTATSAPTGSSTGIAAGTMAQFNHTDVNVAGRDCNFCHTQNGPSTKPGLQGKEWAQAKFHVSFTSTANPLMLNKTNGRCSTCHLAEKPGAAYTAQDHSAFTNAPGSEDCSSCHTFPGTGTVAAPNWLGAGGAPQIITVGGFMIPQPPATGAKTQAGINNLPHPSVAMGASCTTCHTTAAGGKQAIGYNHGSTLENSNCNACHEAGSNLVSPVWNGSTTQSGAAGDTRPFTLRSLALSGCTVTYANHFYPADCAQCHNKPTGTVKGTTGSAYTSTWRFNHDEGKMQGLCSMCHGPCQSD